MARSHVNFPFWDNMAASNDFQRISGVLESQLEAAGMEAHPFKINWYNNKVAAIHHLSYHPDTLAWVVISQPFMFEKLFIPYLVNECRHDRRSDPLDQCMKDYFSGLKHGPFSSDDIEVIHDFELHPSRRPRVLIQTAGHVAGAAYYYQRSDVDADSDPWPQSKKVFGVSVHPRFGGWFALRAVLVFKNVQVPDLEQKSPPDCVVGNEKRIDLLRSLNESWQDWRYREITSFPIVSRYSEDQKRYFGTPPSERGPIIEDIIRKHSNEPELS